MLKVFAVRDVKADAYSALVVLPTRGLAMRGFIDAVQQKGPLSQYPEDHSLYELGEFDESAGTITGYAVPVYIMSAVEAINYLRKEAAKHQLELPGVDNGTVDPAVSK